jgi:hypothetical protein
MPLVGESLPYGLRDIKLTAYTNATTLAGTAVDLPNGRTMSFEEAEDFEELRGDDKVVATRGKGPAVNWELEAGGVSLEALVVLNGGTLTSSGVSPAQKKTYQKKATDARPEFKAEGQAISESGGDFHVVLYRCKSTGGVSGSMGDGSFFITSCKGQALPSRVTANLDALYDFVQNETAVAIA